MPVLLNARLLSYKNKNHNRMVSAIMKVIKTRIAIVGINQQETATPSLKKVLEKSIRSKEKSIVETNTKEVRGATITSYRFNPFAGPHCYF